MVFNIQLTAADVEVIGEALDERPYKRVYDIARRIQAQINAQLQPVVPAAPPAQESANSEG